MNKLTCLLSLIILTTINLKAQLQTTKPQEPTKRYVMVDRKLKQPLQLVDTITKEQMDKGFFVFEKKNTDTLINKFEILEIRLRKVAREHYDEVKWQVGTTLLTIKVVKQSFGDRLNVALSTDTGNGYNQAIYIVDAKLTNNDNARYLKRLISYIENSK